MFNYRLVVAGLKDDLLALYQYKKSSVSFDDLVSSIQVIDDKFKRVAMWLLLREFSNTEVQDFIEKFTKYNPTINVSKEKLQLAIKYFLTKKTLMN